MSYTLQGDFDKSNGCVGVHTRPQVIGDRPQEALSETEGSSVFILASGQEFGQFDAFNIGNGLFRVKAGTVNGIDIHDVRAQNVYRVLEVDSGGSLCDFSMYGVTLYGAERSLARLRGNSGPGLIKACHVDLGGKVYEGDEFQMIIHLDESCHDITLEDINGSNSYDSPDDGYQQGDGICTEGGTQRIVCRRVWMATCADGAFDIKSKTIQLYECGASDCGKSLRVWCQDCWADVFTTRNASRCHINVLNASGGGRTKLVIEHLRMQSINAGVPIILADANQGADVIIKSWEILGDWPKDQIVVKVESGGTIIDWGPQGRPPGKIVE